MRHCKSDWSAGAQSDHDRPLNKRGCRAAEALGQWLRAQDLIPDAVLCSSAERTVETARRLDLPSDAAVTTTRDLYLANPAQMLALVRQAAGNRLLIVGHNPGSAALATELADAWPDHPDFPRYPTGATLVLEFDVDDWSELTPGTGRFIAFTVPRDLG